MRNGLIGLCWAVSFLFPLLAQLQAQQAPPFYTLSGCAYRLALGDTDRDGSPELFYGAYEQHVGCLDLTTGKVLWQRPISGFPFAVATADLNEDGRADFLAACADGSLAAWNHAGEPMWQMTTQGPPLYALAVAHGTIFVGGMNRRLYAVSFKGERLAEIEMQRIANFIVPTEDGVEVLARGPQVSSYRWSAGAFTARKATGLGYEFIPFSSDVAMGVTSGVARVFGTDYAGGARVLAQDRQGKTLWRSSGPEYSSSGALTRRGLFCMTLARLADCVPDKKGLEVVAVTSGVVQLFSATGERLGEAAAPVAFNDVVIHGSTLLLGCSPQGDNTLYRVDLSADWQAQVRGIQRQNKALAIGNELTRFAAQAAQAVAETPPARTAPYVFKVPRYSSTALQPPANLAWARRATQAFGGRCLTYTGWNLFDRDGPAPLLKLARGIEQGDAEVLWTIAHGTTPHLSLSTLKRSLDAAPKRLAGFITHENEDPKRVPSFYRDSIAPVLDLCKDRGKKLTAQNKNVWWFSMPAHREVFDALFADKRGQALVAGTDDANSRTPEINLLSRMGLRQAGLAPRLQASVISDMFSFNRLREWEQVKSGSPMLRLLVAHTVLGAEWFFVRDEYWHGSRPTEEAMEFWNGFLPLLEKGILFTPNPEVMAGLNPIGFAVHPPPEAWLVEAHNGHRVNDWRPLPEFDAAVLPRNGCIWGNAPTPEHALTRVLFRKKRQFGLFVPPTPYGLVAFVPAHADLTQVAGVRSWWHTDGVAVWREGGERLMGMEAARALEASFEEAARQMPFRVAGEDAFLQAVQVTERHYRLFLIDPGWLDPAERIVAIKGTQADRARWTDRLTGEPVDPKRVVIPAGSLRILDAILP